MKVKWASFGLDQRKREIEPLVTWARTKALADELAVGPDSSKREKSFYLI